MRLYAGHKILVTELFKRELYNIHFYSQVIEIQDPINPPNGYHYQLLWEVWLYSWYNRLFGFSY